MLRQTNYGLWVDDDGEKNENEKAIDYIVECAKSVGIEVILGKTALSICFIAEVLKGVKAQATKTEPCEDCVSRQAVLDELNKWDWQELYLPIHFKENIIDVVPSVNPQEPKTDILDKIREEIRKLDDINPDYPMDRTIHIDRDEVLQIIDKYKEG